MAKFALLFIVVFCVVQIALAASTRVVRDAPEKEISQTANELLDKFKDLFTKDNVDSVINKIKETSSDLYNKAKDGVDTLTKNNSS